MGSGAPVLYEHGKQAARGTTPVGNCVEIGKDTFKGRRSIVSDVKFWDADEFKLCGAADAYRSAGGIGGWSISALVRDSSPPSAAERRHRADWADAEMVYRSWEMVELSVTSVPGNANAITLEARSLIGSRRLPPTCMPSCPGCRTRSSSP